MTHPWQPPPRKSRLPLLLGLLLGAVVPFVGLAPPLLLRGVATPPVVSDVVWIFPVGWVFLVLLAGAALLFTDSTRRWGVGVLLGLFGMLIISTVALAALLFVLLSSPSSSV